MRNRTLGACVNDCDYKKVIDYIDLYNDLTQENKSVSQFIWDSIKFYINHLRNQKGIK